MYRVIFEQHVKTGEESGFVDRWQENSDIIQEYPGAKGTGLFRNLGNPAVLYAFADWESLEARMAAGDVIAQTPGLAEKLRDHEQHVERTVVFGEFEFVGVSLPPAPDS